MFTRCPECLSVHTLNASLLAHAGGTVCCGHCQKEFNALDFLFDHWPDSKSSPPQTGAHTAPPVLGKVTASSREDDESPREDSHPSNKNRRAMRGPMTWKIVFAVLIAATIVNAAWTFREPLLGRAEVRSFLVSTGLLDPAPQEPFRDLSQLHLVSRDMHQHPTRAGTLALSLTFVNRAGQAQPYPNIEVTLTDAGNLPLARREFNPSEYLPQGSDIEKGLAPGVHAIALLEFVDPGSRAVGFELSFH